MKFDFNEVMLTTAVWIGVILKILYALVLSVIAYVIQWAVYPILYGFAYWLGDDPPHTPIYPPKCAKIL